MKKWDNIGYQKIIDAKIVKDILFVSFLDSDIIELPISTLLPIENKSYDTSSLKFNEYEILIEGEPSEIIIPWDKVRLLSDSEFAKETVSKSEENLNLVGVRIKELRERKGIKSLELAERAGVTPQTITRIEKGRTDVNFKTLNKLLIAMGYSLIDLANHELKLSNSIQSKSLIFLTKKLGSIGLDSTLIKKILPNQIWQNSIKNDLALPDLIVDEVNINLNRIFGWSNQNIWSGENLNLNESPAQWAYFKKPTNANLANIKAYSFYAYYLANLINNINTSNPEFEYPGDIEEFKFQFLEKYKTINLENLLNYSWDLGISIIPLNDSGVFHGASWNINDKHIIVLKQKTNSHARWIFDLLHEIYHVFVHLENKNSSVIETEEVNPFSSNDSPEELEANSFANQFIFGNRSEQLALSALEKSSYRLEKLKQSIKDIAEIENVPTDFLANYLAFRLQISGHNWWGTANNFQITSPDPFTIASKILKERVEINSLNPIDKNQINSALSN